MPPDIPDFTYGVELELILPRDYNGSLGRQRLADALTAAGIECHVEDYNHLTRRHWKIVTDATIGPENGELVSPVLRGRDGFEAITKACRAVSEFGCSVNRSTGLHVHVGMRDRFHERIGVFKEVIRTYHRFEPILDQLTAPSRRGAHGGNGYCESVRWSHEIEAAANVEELRRAYGDRSKLNFAGAYWRHGTVEFRHHQGTVNAEKAIHWITLCLRMVAHAAKNTEVSREGRSYSALGRPVERRGPVDNSDLWEAEAIVRVDSGRLTRHYNRLVALARSEYGIVWISTPNGTREINTRNSNFSGATGRNMVNALQEAIRRERQRRAPILPPEPVAAGDGIIRPATEMAAGDGIIRPATETTPVTLAGLFDLLEMAPTERNYFTERHMELNAS